MHVEDHPLAYADFEGIIPKGQYGGGTVLLWDRGTWEPLGRSATAGYAAGNLKFLLKGEKLQGGFALVKLRAGAGPRGDDAKSAAGCSSRSATREARERRRREITEARPESVTTGRTIEEIAGDRSRVWHSKPAHVDPTASPGRASGAAPRQASPARAGEARTPPDGRRLAARDGGRGGAPRRPRRRRQGAAALGQGDAAAAPPPRASSPPSPTPSGCSPPRRWSSTASSRR